MHVFRRWQRGEDKVKVLNKLFLVTLKCRPKPETVSCQMCSYTVQCSGNPFMYCSPVCVANCSVRNTLWMTLNGTDLVTLLPNQPRPHQDRREKKRGVMETGLIQPEGICRCTHSAAATKGNAAAILFLSFSRSHWSQLSCFFKVILFLTSWLCQWINATKWYKKVTSFSFSYHTTAFPNQTHSKQLSPVTSKPSKQDPQM